MRSDARHRRQRRESRGKRGDVAEEIERSDNAATAALSGTLFRGRRGRSVGCDFEHRFVRSLHDRMLTRRERRRGRSKAGKVWRLCEAWRVREYVMELVEWNVWISGRRQT